MHIWNWQTWQGRPYLTCTVLQGFSHGFFTQQWSPQPPDCLVASLAPQAPAYRTRQVHGNVVLATSEITPRQTESGETAWPNADGVLSEQPQESVWVCSADCVPALVADVRTGQVAAVHAGWRGTALEILPKAIARLQAQGSQIDDLRVALGPAIDGAVYQVSTTVAAEVGATVVGQPKPEHEAAIAEILLALGQLPHSPLSEDPQPGRARLDVRRVNALQLEQLGFLPEQVAIAPYCTYQQAEHFFSYRRDRLKNVQWSGIVSR